MRLSLSKCVSQARVSSSRTPASKEDISSSRLAHSRPYHRQRLRPPRIIDSTLLKPTESVSLTRLLSPFVQHVQAIQRRTFIRPPLDSRELGSVNLLEIKKFLRQKSIEFTESHACIAIQIPKHLVSGDTAPINWKALDTAFSVFYINKTTGDYVCPELAVCDDWNALREFLSAWCRNRNLKKTDPREELPHLSQLLPPSNTDSGQELWQLAEPVEALDALEFRALLKTFRLPVKELKPEDFARFEARVKKVYLTDGDDEDQKKVVYELLFPVRYINGVIVGIRRIFKCPEKGTIVEESVTSQTPLLTSAPNQCRVLPFPHGLDAAYRAHASSVVLVSSVLDSLVLSVKSPDGAIFPVALAEGALTLPPEHLPFFEQFDGGITFWFPDNVTAYDSVRTFARKLGEKRCNVVTRDVPQPHMWIRQKQETDILMVVRKLIRPCSHEYITTFESMRDDVFLEIAHHEEIRGVRWKRFDQLNDLLGGFRRGELTVFSGRTGSGKTTFMSEYSLDLCAQNVTTLWGSFEVKNTRLAKMQLRQLAAVNFEDHLDQFDKWADRFQKLPMYYLTFHGAQEIDKVLDAMGHAVYIYDIAHVIIDNIQFMMGSGTNGMDRYFTQDLIIQKFRKFATLHNVHVALVIHPRKEDDDRLTANSIFGGAKATQEADNVILLQEEEINPKIKRKYIQVVKNRFSGDLGFMPLFFNRTTSTFSKKIFQKEKSQRKKESPKIDANLDGAESLPQEVLIPPDH